MDGGAWWATVHGVAKSWTQLSNFPKIKIPGATRVPQLPLWCPSLHTPSTSACVKESGPIFKAEVVGGTVLWEPARTPLTCCGSMNLRAAWPWAHGHVPAPLWACPLQGHCSLLLPLLAHTQAAGAGRWSGDSSQAPKSRLIPSPPAGSLGCLFPSLAGFACEPRSEHLGLLGTGVSGQPARAEGAGEGRGGGVPWAGGASAQGEWTPGRGGNGRGPR